VRLDRIGPGGVRRGEARLDVVLHAHRLILAPLWVERLSVIT
jgi:hypothetical protein